MQRVRFVFPLVILALALLPGRAVAGDPTWVRVTSENFVVYSDAGEKRAAEVARELESFRGLLASLFPEAVTSSHSNLLPVVAFRSDSAFKPYKPLYNGKPANLAGVFLRSSEHSMVALDTSSWRGTSHTIYHEYIHRLLAGSDVPVPAWFNEGLAEFYSTAEVKGKKAELGRPISERVLTLRDRGMMPLAQLFAVTHGSPEYNERSKQGIFYAQSWAFVHYMILNENRDRPKQLQQFSVRMGRGEPAETAFRAAFGTDMATMEKELRRYVSGTSMPMVTIDYDTAREEAAVKVEPAPAVEVEYQLGNILALSRRFEDAEAQYRKAAAADPASSLPHEGLGVLGLYRQDQEAAKAAFGEAVKRDSKSATALYFYARSLADEPGEARKSAVAVIERSIAVNPDFARSHALMARVLRLEREYEKAAAAGRRAVDLAPEDAYARIEYAMALVEGGKYDEGRAQLVRILENGDDEGLRSFAQNTIAQLDRLAESRAAVDRAPADASWGEERPPADSGPPRLRRERPEPEGGSEGGGAEAMVFMAPAGQLSVRGVLKRLVCDATTMTAVLDVGGRIVKLTSTKPEEVSLTTPGLGGSETIACDEPLDREVVVHFLSTVSGAPGEMTTIVFTTLPAK
jgi:tetratricopeptide (TPR) repeat protein